MKLAKIRGFSSLKRDALYKQARNTLVSVLACLCLALPASVNAQEDDDASIELEIAIVSNYVWRGENIFDKNKSIQDDKLATGSTSVPAFQPSITFYPGGEWYFNIWYSRAMSNRGDKDLGLTKTEPDRFSSPPGPGIDYNPCDDDSIRAALKARGRPDDSIDDDDIDDNRDRKCSNGLQRSDEVDYTIGYEKESNIGTVGFGIVSYTLAYYKGEKGDTSTEMFFSYSPAGDLLSNLYFNIYSGIGNPTGYYQVGYGYELGLGDDMSLSFDIAAGYQDSSDISGWKDYTGSVGLNVHGIDLSLNVAQRVHSEFYDDDDDPHDFKTKDENGELTDIEKMLMWIYVGYTHEF